MKRAALCAVLSASAAGACPVASDLAQGVVLTSANGDTEIHTVTAPGFVQVDLRYGDDTGDGNVAQLAQGLYVRSIIPVENGVMTLSEQEIFISTATLGRWAAPRPNAEWGVDAPDGGTATSGPMRTVAIGACVYDSFDVMMTYADDPDYSDTYTYLPEFGTALLIAITENGRTDRYTYVSIATR